MLSTTDTFVSHVEMLNQPLDEGAGQAAGWFLDDAVIPSSTTETSTNLTVNGLWHLNGKTVSMTVGGIDCGDYTVSNGSFTATFGTPALFTKALVDGGAQIVVGFTYTSQGQTVRPVDPKETGSRIGPALGTKRRSDHFAVLFQEAAGVSVGTNFSKLLPVLFKDDGQNAYAGNQLFSGVWWDTMNDDYTFDGMFAWQITRPLPCTIVAFGNTLGGED